MSKSRKGNLRPKFKRSVMGGKGGGQEIKLLQRKSVRNLKRMRKESWWGTGVRSKT